MTASTVSTQYLVVDAARLHALRYQAGLSIPALARRADVSYPAVWRMAQGGNAGGCRPFTLMSVASALGVAPAALLAAGAETAPCPTCGQSTGQAATA